MREVKFELDVLASAEYEPNVTEFFSRAYLTEDVADNFRVLPNIKNKTKMAYVLFAGILQASSCNFSATGATVGTVTVDVEALSAMIEICQFELEQSFVVSEMTKGANADFSVGSFLAFFWERAADKIAEEIELARWQGEEGGAAVPGLPVLSLVDGYETILNDAVNGGVTATLTGGTGTAAVVVPIVNNNGTITGFSITSGGAYSVAPTGVTLAGVGEGSGATFGTITTTGSSPNIAVTAIQVTNGGTAYPQKPIKVNGTTLSASNILTEMGRVFAKIPNNIRRNKALLRWHMSPIAADFYMQAAAAGNTNTYLTKALDLTYLGIKIVVNDGLSDNKMYLTRRDNLIYSFDLAGDQKSLRLIDLTQTTGDALLRARTNIKIGFQAVNLSEIVAYY